tara:strand:+ start:620 stop:1024 length:405 start_codon:yes stop_codon:yes gene_type:complete
MERNEINQDSIKSVDAWKDFKSGYMNRGNKTPEENQAEYDREKNEFYFNKEKGTLRLIPTDDAEIQDKSGIEDWQLAPSRKSALNMLGISRKSSPFNFKGANSSNSKCWKGYKKVGTKPSPTNPGVTVNDCKKI